MITQYWQLNTAVKALMWMDGWLKKDTVNRERQTDRQGQTDAQILSVLQKKVCSLPDHGLWGQGVFRVMCFFKVKSLWLTALVSRFMVLKVEVTLYFNPHPFSICEQNINSDE